jgi:hypothetical protein
MVFDSIDLPDGSVHLPQLEEVDLRSKSGEKAPYWGAHS